MKLRLFSLLLAGVMVLPVMTGCLAVGNETGLIDPGTAALTAEDARRIALEYAGFTDEQVTALHTEYEIDDGVAQYNVDFRHGRWEYDYEIHAGTGEILSFSRED